MTSIIQTIFQNEFPSYAMDYVLPNHKYKTFHFISKCRTNDMGFNSFRCNDCSHHQLHYNSCRNRHCPTCQNIKREQWIDKFESYLLDIPYFHVVFTIPHQLNNLTLLNQKMIYNIFFKAASESLTTLTADKYGKISSTFILHTWGQTLAYHPHLHAIVSSGGLKTNDDGSYNFCQCNAQFLVSIKALSIIFKNKFLSLLKKSINKLDLTHNCSYLNQPIELDNFISSLYQLSWITYIKKPFGNNKAVLNYIGRYSHRVAISNNRILNYDNQLHNVTFSYKDYKNDSKRKKMTVSASEFLRRFSLHILPSYFMKIRHYGLLANNVRNSLIPLCRALISKEPSPTPNEPPTSAKVATIDVPSRCQCPKCGGVNTKFFVFSYYGKIVFDSS